MASSQPKLPPQSPEFRHQNALKWIRHIAGMHYFGGAFDPEHMRDLANLAADALAGSRDLPDFDEAQKRSRKRAARLAAKFARNFTEPGGGGDA